MTQVKMTFCMIPGNRCKNPGFLKNGIFGIRFPHKGSQKSETEKNSEYRELNTDFRGWKFWVLTWITEIQISILKTNHWGKNPKYRKMPNPEDIQNFPSPEGIQKFPNTHDYRNSGFPKKKLIPMPILL